MAIRGLRATAARAGRIRRFAVQPATTLPVGGMKPVGNTARIVLIVLLAIAVIGAFVAWFLHSYEKVERVIDLPPRGEAEYNPLYVLKKALQAEGVKVESRQRVDLAAQKLGARD